MPQLIIQYVCIHACISMMMYFGPETCITKSKFEFEFEKCSVCKFCASIRCHWTKSLHKMCETSWWKNNRLFYYVNDCDFEPNYWSKVYILPFKKINSYASSGIVTHNPWGLRLRNTCAIGCANKTAEIAFKQNLVWLM